MARIENAHRYTVVGTTKPAKGKPTTNVMGCACGQVVYGKGGYQALNKHRAHLADLRRTIERYHQMTKTGPRIPVGRLGRGPGYLTYGCTCGASFGPLNDHAGPQAWRRHRNEVTA